MAKTLILAEKPSVGREIARVLGCRQTGDGYISGEKYIVTWALGHLVTLADPEQYDEKYKTWSMETLPMLPEKMKLVVIGQTSKQFNAVRRLMARSDISSLIIATDAGREGELVARWIIEKAGWKKPIKRLWISSQTDRAIKQGFNSLKDGKDYYNLYRSAQCRAEADWLVGLNVTRALTCRHNAQLSAGRVQTPTLAVILDREREIREFKPRDYYNVNADLGDFFVRYRLPDGSSAIYDKAEAERIAAAVKGGTFNITAIKTLDKRTPPPALYDLTELQRDANKLYGLSAKQTLNCMQRLYEYHKVLTYPRTDSRYITDDIVPTLSERLRAVAIGDFALIVKQARSINRSCVNNAKVSDHHAIIPTEQRADLDDMNADDKRIYLLVIRRFLANFLPDYSYRELKLELKSEGMSFTSSGREVTDAGWKRIYSGGDDESDGDEPEQNLPFSKKGDSFKCINVQLKALKTSPPPRYTEASLLSVMENPSKFIRDVKMKEYIEGGLGTPATRADIIEKLFSSFYLEKNGNYLVPTSKAEQLIKLVPSDLREPTLTATWEKKLESISRGQADSKAFINEIREYTSCLVREVANSEQSYAHDNMTRDPCPECGKFLLRVNGKRGTMLVCQDRNCSYRRNVTLKTNVRCPNCHKTMEIFGEGEKRTYACVCGFRERVGRFHAEKAERGASKAEVRRFLSQQSSKDDETESPLAAAFRRAMEKKEK